MAAEVAAGSSVQDVAKRYGVNPSAVSQACKKRGVRTKADQSERNIKIIELMRAGMQMKEAAARFDLSVSAVSRLCAKNGLTRKWG